MTPDRLARVDVLRGMAILLVVLHHYLLTFTQQGVRAGLTTSPGALDSWLFVAHDLGYLGVPLFFVLSGFCIHNSYLSWRRKTLAPTKRAFLADYFNRRFWRIYPPYFCALVLTFLIVYWPQFDARAFRHLALHASLTNTLSESFFYNINPAFWSIAVEWQLYVIYPLLLLLRRWLGVWPAFLIAAGVSGFWRFGLPTFTEGWALLHLPFRWWLEWALGFLIADLRADQRLVVPYPALTSALLLVLMVLSLKLAPTPFVSWLLVPLAFGTLLQAACRSTRPLTRIERTLCVIGISSYSLYLLHNPVLWLTAWLLREHTATLPPWMVWGPLCAAVFAVMQGLAWLMFRRVEQPSIAAGRIVAKACGFLRVSHPARAATCLS